MSGDIIFENLIDKINLSSNNINEYFKNSDLYNTNIYDILSKIPKYNIIIYILIIFLIFNFIGRLTIRLNEILIFLVCTVLIYILIKKDYTDFINFTGDKKLQLDYLHKLIFNNKEYDFSSSLNTIIKPPDSVHLSYLYLNPVIVQFYYDMRQQTRYNISSYVNSVIHSNNVIGLDYQSRIGINRSYLNYQLAIDETKKALNELNSVIYKIPSTIVNYKKFNKCIIVLHQLLNKHILDMSILFKNDNKTNDINSNSMPNNFYDEYFIISSDDTKMKGYMPVFNMY